MGIIVVVFIYLFIYYCVSLSISIFFLVAWWCSMHVIVHEDFLLCKINIQSYDNHKLYTNNFCLWSKNATLDIFIIV